MNVAPLLCVMSCALIFDHTKVSQNDVYAVLIDGSRLPADFFAIIQSDGGNICFTSDAAGTTLIPVEVVAGSIDLVNKKVEIWIPLSLSVTTDVTIYVWYGSKVGTLTQPAANGTYGSQAVWSTVSTDLLGVYHLGTPSSLSWADSTSNANNGTNSGSTATTGQIGGGAAFNGTNQGASLPINLSSTNKASIQCWANITSYSGTKLMWEYSPNFNGSSGFILEIDANTSNMILASQSGPIYNGGGFTKPSAGNWHHWHVKYDRTTGTSQGQAVVIDGAPVSITQNQSSSLTGNFANSTLYLMCRALSSLFEPGAMDEIRVRTSNPSANYSATDYAVQASTSLVTVGTPRRLAGVPVAAMKGATL